MHGWISEKNCPMAKSQKGSVKKSELNQIENEQVNFSPYTSFFASSKTYHMNRIKWASSKLDFQYSFLDKVRCQNSFSVLNKNFDRKDLFLNKQNVLIYFFKSNLFPDNKKTSS
jgi:hypothetical protein